MLRLSSRSRDLAANSLSEIDLQVMWSRLIAVVEEQAQVLLRTAFSPIVREAGDLSAGVFDREGRMLAQAVTGTPGHVNSMAEAVRHFIARFPLEAMKPGDIYITNDPWMGTGHLNDFVLTTPCFHRGRLVALFSCTSHLMDIGGIGFGPDGTDVFMEGIYIPHLKLADHDRLAAHICERSREAVLAEIATLPKGSWQNEMTVDGYDTPVTLFATTTIRDNGIHVDYEGTGPASPRGINVPLAYTTAYTV